MGQEIEDFNENLRQVVRLLMRWRGLTYRQFAIQMGFSRPNAELRLTSSASRWRPDELARLARVFAVPMSLLLRHIDELRVDEKPHS